jgi:hypothetical protein
VLKNITFGVFEHPDQFTALYGSLGLGFGKGINTNGSNFIDELFEQGVTETKAFSFTLKNQDINTDQGSLIFGGVDTKQFAGPLHRQAVVEPPLANRTWPKNDEIR